MITNNNVFDNEYTNVVIEFEYTTIIMTEYESITMSTP